MNVWPYLEHQKGHFVLFSRKILVVKLPHKLKLCKTILVAHVQSKPCHSTVYLKGFRWKKENATDASFTFLSNKKFLILSSPWMKILMISQCMSLWKKSHPFINFFFSSDVSVLKATSLHHKKIWNASFGRYPGSTFFFITATFVFIFLLKQNFGKTPCKFPELLSSDSFEFSLEQWFY